MIELWFLKNGEFFVFFSDLMDLAKKLHDFLVNRH